MSLYNHNLKTIFIHIPRTAGTSMEKLVGGQGHKDIIYFKRFMYGQTEGLDFDKIFKFSFVRHPFDRFISSYFHDEVQNQDMEINDFVSVLAESYREWPEDSIIQLLFKPQWKFLCNQYQDIQVDFVGKFEHLATDWKYVAKKIGVKNKLPHENASKRKKGWEKYLTSQSQAILAELYELDFRVFGYKNDIIK